PQRSDDVQRSLLNPPAPKGLTLWERLRSVTAAVGEPRAAVRASFQGALRVKGNGLGFDATRLAAATTPYGDNWVDPVVEVLAFAGSILVPVRGDGARRTLRLRDQDGSIRWGSWPEAVSVFGIDALLDLGA